MSNAESWQTAEIGGPKKASVILKPLVARAIIDHAHHPILVIGQRAAKTDIQGKKFVDFLVELARVHSIPIIATGHVSLALRARDCVPALILPAVEAGQRIADPAWNLKNGNGPCDLVIIAGLPYPMAWTLLSGLKHNAPQVKTLNLDNTYQPNASWSFANISVKEWQEYLVVLVTETVPEGSADV